MYVCVHCGVNLNGVKWCRVEQEIMARIVSEMHDRRRYNPAVQSQLNPGQRSMDHVSHVSSVASDVQTTDDPMIGWCHIGLNEIKIGCLSLSRSQKILLPCSEFYCDTCTTILAGTLS